jgi:hypothetical protein
MNQIKALERLAINAFRRCLRWSEYWQAHGDEVKQCEPFNARRFKRLYDRLLHLLTSGDTNGQQSIIDDSAEPWVQDDTSTPSDSVTAARCLWPAQSTQKVPR